MKCSRCGYVARTLAGMAAHYRKKHPQAMKRKKQKPRLTPLHKGKGARYCPMCGQPL